MLLFFDQNITIDTEEFTFDRTESKHLVKVLRKEKGAQITLTNGRGLQWNGILTEVSPNKSTAKKTKAIHHLAPKKKIHLAIAPTKRNERMEWMIEKLTEIGIASITPILCDHSERKVVKTERYFKIAVAALKQSQQFFLPQINPLTPFEAFLKTIKHPALIAHCSESPKCELSKYALNSDEITLFVGPEGDFSSQEIKTAMTAGLEAVSLGSQRFRTETAGLLGCHTLFLK